MREECKQVRAKSTAKERELEQLKQALEDIQGNAGSTKAERDSLLTQVEELNAKVKKHPSMHPTDPYCYAAY